MLRNEAGRFRIEDGQIDIWLTRPCGISSDLLCRYRELLSESERVRWRRFVARDAQLQYIVSRALIRTTLSRYFEVPASSWRFATDGYGRPHIDAPDEFRHLQFNISHATGLVACALARVREIGIDVENIRRDLAFDDLARAVFSPIEASHFLQSAPELRREVFFSYWTLKEAYIKARGRGLSLPLNAFWLNLGDDPPRIHFTDRCPDDPHRWQLRQYAPTRDHKLALAVAQVKELKVNQRWVIPLAEPTRQHDHVPPRHARPEV